MVPSISRFQWHPFTVAGGSADGVLTLHVKRYGPFTKELLNGLRRRRPTTVRVAGPIGCETTADCQLLPSASWERQEVLVLFGGGVGVSQGRCRYRRAVIASASESSSLGSTGCVSIAASCHPCPLVPPPPVSPQVTALLSMLRAMAERRAAGETAGLPRRVYFVWAARALGEFKSLDAPLLDVAA
jgi:hypothetical protein